MISSPLTIVQMLTLYEVEPQLIVSPQLLNGHPIRGGGGGKQSKSCWGTFLLFLTSITRPAPFKQPVSIYEGWPFNRAGTVTGI